MMTLIIGENDSGKSSFAESYIAQLSNPRYYVATMIVKRPEDEERVKKHLEQREGLGFHTREVPYDVHSFELPTEAIVLLEDVSNLVANEWFDRRKPVENVFRDILALEKKCQHLVIVTIDGLNPSDYTGETKDYATCLNWINQQLTNHSNQVIRMPKEEPCLGFNHS